VKENLYIGSIKRGYPQKECPSPVQLAGNSVEIYDSETDTLLNAKLEKTEVASRRSKDGLVITTSCFYKETGKSRSCV